MTRPRESIRRATHRAWREGQRPAVAALAGLMLAACATPVAPPWEAAARRAFPEAGALHLDPLPGIDDGYAVIGADGSILGSLVRRSCRAMSGTFEAVVVLDRNRTIRRVEVRDYRGQRGGEIVSTNHLRQYVGKKPGHPLRLGDDIDGVSGATWSSRSLADAVRDIVTRAVDFDAGS